MTFVPRTPEGKSLGKGAQWTGEIRLLPWALDVPLRRKKPTTYFVNSLCDVFHESLVGCEEGREFIAAMFGVMNACPQHTFQLLTKRDPRPWFDWLLHEAASAECEPQDLCMRAAARLMPESAARMRSQGPRDVWPLPNVQFGVSVEDQQSADWAIPILLKLPAATRFLSAEPLLGPVDLSQWMSSRLPVAVADAPASWGDFPWPDWVIVGGESGPKARPCDVGWIRSVVEQCKDAGIPCFVKQLGARPLLQDVECRACDGEGVSPQKKGGDMNEWPEDLRVRQMPSEDGEA
jgi:protein gp37